MCRIVGGIDFVSNLMNHDIIRLMNDTLAHGGPDSEGIFIDSNLGLGHRRLSILDLSDSGKQPMSFGKFVISYNGEVYNFKDIRKELERNGINFLTNTDTEVIIKSIELWGMNAVDKFRGMFAFALWNREEKSLILCRDRFGVKPLYWYYNNGLFLFSSELKAFHKHPNFDKSIDLRGIPHYLSKGYFKETDCIFKYVNKVQPGHYLLLDKFGDVSINCYWSINLLLDNAVINNSHEQILTDELEELLTKSFKLRMVSDVPVGIFLSGGIDSALITALLQKKCNYTLNTFTIGFEDKAFDESEVAKRIANLIGTNHTSIICSENDFKNVIPKLSTIYDEPFGDSSSIPTFLVSQLASQSVKVALSGDGGDELFGGYSRYLYFKKYNAYLKLPVFFRKNLNELSYKIKPSSFLFLAKLIGKNNFSQLDSKYFKLRQTFEANNLTDFFDATTSFLGKHEVEKLVSSSNEELNYFSKNPKDEKIISYLGYLDLLTYLPGDILTKVDRASMSVALETREPYLDPEILNFSFSLPSNFKISSTNESKKILKNVLAKYLPNDIINRPKYGFTIPISNWMNSYLKSEIQEICDDINFCDTFQLNRSFLREMIFSVINNKGQYNPHSVWFIFCLYKWYKQWI